MYSAPVQYKVVVYMTGAGAQIMYMTHMTRYWYTIVLWLTLVDQSEPPVAEEPPCRKDDRDGSKCPAHGRADGADYAL